MELLNLEYLGVGSYGIWGDGLEHLGSCPSLVEVNLRGCSCDEDTLTRIAKIPSLRRLYFTNMAPCFSPSSGKWQMVPNVKPGGVDETLLAYQGITVGKEKSFFEWLRQLRPNLESGISTNW